VVTHYCLESEISLKVLFLRFCYEQMKLYFREFYFRRFAATALNGAGFANNSELTHCLFNGTAEDGNLECMDMGYHNLYFECRGNLTFFSNAMAENILMSRQFSARPGFQGQRGGGWRMNK
jgi:hypothetical protein